MSGIMGTVATGMAFGAGSEVGHQAVRSLMGGGGHGGHAPAQEAPQQQQYMEQPAQQQYAAPQQMQQQQENPCQRFNLSFVQCIKTNANEVSLCQQYMDMLTQCEKDLKMNQQWQ